MGFFLGEPGLLILIPAVIVVLNSTGLMKRYSIYPSIILCLLGLLRPYAGYLPADWKADTDRREALIAEDNESINKKSVIVRLNQNTLHVGDSLIADVQGSGLRECILAISSSGRSLHQEKIAQSSTDWFRRIRYRVQEPGLSELRVLCSAADDEIVEVLPVLVIEKTKVLVVAHDSREAESLVAVLEQDDMDVTVASPSEVPVASSLENFACVVIYDVPNVFEESQVQALSEFVHGGGGLLVIAGPKLFSIGAYRGSELGRLLPVRPDIPKQIEKYKIALGFVIDTSGSMAEVDDGARKIDLASEAALASALELQEGKDQIAILAFAGKANWVSELSDLDESSLARKLAQLQPGGETDLMSGLIKMRLAMEASNARIRHVLILSDGLTVGETSDFQAMAKRFAGSGVTLSAISLGVGGNDLLLKLLADEGGGKFYKISRASELVKVFTQDTRRHTRSGLIERPLKVKVPRPPAWADGISFESLPPLLGMVASVPKDHSVVHIRAENGLPLLTSCRRGLGQVFLFSSDAGDRYARLWVDAWSDFGPFWSQLVRYASKDTTGDYRPEYVSTPWGRGILVRNCPEKERQPALISIADSSNNNVGVCSIVHVLGPGLLWAPLRHELEEGHFVCSFDGAVSRPFKVTNTQAKIRGLKSAAQEPVWPFSPFQVFELAPLCFALAAVAYVLERMTSSRQVDALTVAKGHGNTRPRSSRTTSN
ncbi:MAG: VWA domain-containing protein [Planctomycetota bacterium]|nr:VWA domain-containing protein [Planctomycetota bacterium]